MNNMSRGPGVRKFWETHISGEEVDVAAIVNEHPDEALALADAIREAAVREDSFARENMWLARAEVLSRGGEEVTLGALLRTSRQDVALSPADLSSSVREHGISLSPTAIEMLEADRANITNVTTPGLWMAIAEILEVDRYQLVATIRGTLANSRSTQRFTRMNRGATSADREGLLGSGVTPQREDSADSYIGWVRAELGLPPSPADTI